MATPCNCDTFIGNVTIDGSLGIGTTAPAGALDVSGSGATIAAYLGPTSDDFGVLVLRGGSAGTYWELAKLRSVDAPADGFLLQAVTGSSSLPVLLASPSGQVGIGTTTPAYPLDVAGDVHTSGALRADGPLYAVAAPGQGDAVFVGNDSKLVDINVANTAGLYGQQDGTVGSLKLGSGGGTLSGADGNIGIGTTAPAFPLVVQAASTDRVRLSICNANNQTSPGVNSRSADLMFSGYDPTGTTVRDTFEIATDAEQNGTQSLFIYDTVARAYRLYVGPGGNVGIATTTPAHPLDVNGDINASGSVLASGRKVADGNGCYYS